MIRFIYKLTIISLLAFVSCKPDPIPPPVSNEPVFRLSGTLGNDSINIAAGLDDYYLDSDFEKDDLDILIFKGAFKKANCTNCTEEMTISIRDRKITNPGDNFILEMSLKTGSYPVAQFSDFTIIDPNIFEFYPADILPYMNWEYQWVFNGIDTFNGIFPIYRFPNLAEQTIKLNILDPASSCTETWEQTIKLAGSSSHISFSYDNDPFGAVFFLIPQEEIEISSSVWDFGDGGSSEQYGSVNVVPHLYSSGGTYTACADIELINGTFDSYCNQVQSHEGIGCSAGFDYYPRLFSDGLFFSSVEFEWVDANGKKYTSLILDMPIFQPSDSFFEITEVEPFDNDLDGQKTMKITAKAKATLFNIDDPSDSMVLETDKLIFAVAYPNL